MARVGEFSSSNVIRFLLGIFIAVVLLLAVSAWLFYSPGHGPSIEDNHQATPSASPK